MSLPQNLKKGGWTLEIEQEMEIQLPLNNYSPVGSDTCYLRD